MLRGFVISHIEYKGIDSLYFYYTQARREEMGLKGHVIILKMIKYSSEEKKC